MLLSRRFEKNIEIEGRLVSLGGSNMLMMRAFQRKFDGPMSVFSQAKPQRPGQHGGRHEHDQQHECYEVTNSLHLNS